MSGFGLAVGVETVLVWPLPLSSSLLPGLVGLSQEKVKMRSKASKRGMGLKRVKVRHGGGDSDFWFFHGLTSFVKLVDLTVYLLD
jgi:hypothetical protein